MAIIQPIDQVPATSEFHFLAGSYSRSNHPIPYLSMTMSFLDAAQSLHLASELPGAEEVEWEIEELYQRDIDWTRVRDRIVPYLNNQDAPNFFNSITIAALPYDPTTQTLGDSFEDSGVWKPPPLLSAVPYKMDIGPISLGYAAEWDGPHDAAAQVGVVRWNPTQVFSVAIDGQHRLAAIKMLVGQNSTDPRHLTSKVPILILLLDPRLGYQPNQMTNVEVIRRLFIDLNKHAQSVSRARQILLDDHEPHAVAIRQIIGKQLSAGLDDLASSPPRLPLSLVDWFSEQAKFEKGPFVTTVLTLDWLVAAILGTSPVGDYTNYNVIKTQIDGLERNLGVSLQQARERLKILSSVKLSPFEYSGRDLALIGYSFRRLWADALVVLFTQFRPYGALISRRSDDKSLSLEFQDWFRLYTRAKSDSAPGRHKDDYAQLLERLRQPRPGHTQIGESQLESWLSNIEDHKAQNGLAYYVVFQKALLHAMIDYIRLPPAFFGDLLEDDDWDVDFELDGLEVSYEGGSDSDDLETDEVAEPDEIPEPADISAVAIDGGSDLEIGDGLFGFAPEELAAYLTASHEDLLQTVPVRAGEFVEIVNRIVDGWPEFLSIAAPAAGGVSSSGSFWLGSLRKAEGDVDFAQAAAKRGWTLLLALVLLVIYKDAVSDADDSSFDEAWSRLLTGDGPALVKKLNKLVMRLAEGDQSVGKRILTAREEEFDLDSSLAELEVRFGQIWSIT